MNNYQGQSIICPYCGGIGSGESCPDRPAPEPIAIPQKRQPDDVPRAGEAEQPKRYGRSLKEQAQRLEIAALRAELDGIREERKNQEAGHRAKDRNIIACHKQIDEQHAALTAAQHREAKLVALVKVSYYDGRKEGAKWREEHLCPYDASTTKAKLAALPTNAEAQAPVSAEAMEWLKNNAKGDYHDDGGHAAREILRALGATPL